MTREKLKRLVEGLAFKAIIILFLVKSGLSTIPTLKIIVGVIKFEIGKTGV